MATVDSSTGGVMLPADAPAPDEDDALDALFQQAVSVITGIAGNLVRPRWQPANPKQPEPNIDWCAIGVMTSDPDAGPFIEHISTGAGTDRSIRHETIDVLASFYGPHAKTNAGRLRDGLGIPQNIEPLAAKDVSYVGCGRVLTVPELANQQWIRRQDMPITFRRKVTRIYAVRNIVAADIHLFDDTHVDEVIEVPPAAAP